MTTTTQPAFGRSVTWSPARPKLRPLRLLVAWVASALALFVAAWIVPGATVNDFWGALAASAAIAVLNAVLPPFVAAAAGVVLDVVLGTNDDDTYTFRVVQRIARRTGGRTITDAPGIVFLEIDGLGLPVLQRAMRDGNAP